MKSLKKTSFFIFIILTAIILLTFFYIGWAAKKGLPDYTKNLSLSGLKEPVKVYRDSFAIPHIYAGNDHDLYMATGYIMAQDRIWQMDFLRRVTQGRLSEIFGDDFIDTDLLLRSLAFGEKSQRILDESDPVLVQALEAFSSGVNQYLEDNRKKLPIEFTILGYKPESWEPAHSLNLIGFMAWDLKAGWSELILEELAKKVDSIHLNELLPDPLKQKVCVFGQNAELLAASEILKLSDLENMGLDIFSGSNNWAVSADKSVTGRPLLANDMHLGFGIPGIWLQIHQVIGNELNVEGLALPGQPLIIVGHNDSIAWGMTNTYVDNLDYYEERINPDDSNQYMFNGEWKDFTIHKEKIKSKSGDEFERIYRTNHRGPVVSEVKGIKDKVLTMHWVGSEKSNEIRTIYMLNRAKNWNEFRDAFTSFRSISQNVAYADVMGNIGIYCCAGVPIRKRDKAVFILPGWTDEYDWTGMIPFDELPFEYNPSCGYVSSANNRAIDNSYPYHIGTWYDMPYRLNRIREMLNSRQKFSVDDFITMQNDQVSAYSQLFLERMLPLIENNTGLNDSKKKALELMKKWDNNLGMESSEATLFEYWSYLFFEMTYKDEIGDELFNKMKQIGSLSRNAIFNLLMQGNSCWIDNITTEKIETLTDIAVQSFSAAVDTLEMKMGKDMTMWKWGSIHKLTISHPLGKVKILDKIFGLNRGPFEVGGSYHTVSPYKYPLFQPDKTEHGSSHRNIYDLDDWDKCISVIPTGTSGIPSSRFYCDQTKMYISGTYHEDHFSSGNIKLNAMFEMEFIPAVP